MAATENRSGVGGRLNGFAINVMVYNLILMEILSTFGARSRRKSGMKLKIFKVQRYDINYQINKIIDMKHVFPLNRLSCLKTNRELSKNDKK